MMTENRPPLHVKTYSLSFAAVWLLLVSISCYWTISYHKEETNNIAIAEARAYFNRDQSIRAWATGHGGVYVPVTEQTQPNPYLSQITDRDITKPSGVQLTLMNPAYIMRQLNEDFSGDVKGHVTSLNPLRPENAPDAWERSALLAFEQGKDEVLEFTSINGVAYVRLMRPIITKEGCLKCHGFQGYKVGDVRGGGSVSLPMAGLLESFNSDKQITLFSHALLFILGLFGIFWAAISISGKIEERNRVALELKKSEEKFKTVSDFTYAWEYWIKPDGALRYVSPSCKRITGYEPEKFIRDQNFIHTIIFPEDKAAFKVHIDKELKHEHVCEITFRIINKRGEVRWIHHICQPVYDSTGAYLGRRASNHDNTKRKQAEEEKEKLIVELKGALNKVKLLSGLLPICASCKKIRDDKGSWKQIESYIRKRSEAEFSHGICPDCAKKLYPDIDL